MKTLPAGLSSQLQSGVTTLCRCWLLERRDGMTLGFTDHDHPLTFDGVTFEADAGMTASPITQSDALNVDTVDIAGALRSDRLTEADLARGLYDRAALTLYLVDWSNPVNRDVMFAGSIGEVSRGPSAFRVEMRGLTHALNQQVGRIYARLCDADLGDSRCSVDLSGTAFKGDGAVMAAAGRHIFSAAGLGAYVAGWFARGRLIWTSGANASVAVEIKAHVNNGEEVSFELRESMPFDIEAGDTFEVSAGCDKAVATCAQKFDNVANFRGFPFLATNDALLGYPNTGDNLSGGSRNA